MDSRNFDFFAMYSQDLDFFTGSNNIELAKEVPGAYQ
jgi:hypothetical protein